MIRPVNPPSSRQIVSKLLAEKISFAPEDRNGEKGFRFEATGTVEKLVTGAIPEFSQAMVSPRGSEGLQVSIERWFAVVRTGARGGASVIHCCYLARISF